MQEVRGGGHYPMESRCDPYERQTADKLRKRQKVGSLSPEQKAELHAMLQAHIDDRAEIRKAELDMLVQKVRELGRYPKRSQWSKGEGKLASDVLIARRFKQFSPEQEAELETFMQAESHAREAARIADVVKMMQGLRSLRRYPKEGARRVDN